MNSISHIEGIEYITEFGNSKNGICTIIKVSTTAVLTLVLKKQT